MPARPAWHSSLDKPFRGERLPTPSRRLFSFSSSKSDSSLFLNPTLPATEDKASAPGALCREGLPSPLRSSLLLECNVLEKPLWGPME
jgi:hypothetical protein